MSNKKLSVGLARRSDEHVALLDDPPVGHLQAIVLKRLDVLGRDASGYSVLEGLSIDTGVWIDPSQIYASIRKLVDKELISLAETRPQPGGPPLKIYQLTAAGRAALKTTAEHHREVAAFLTNDKRNATRK